MIDNIAMAAGYMTELGWIFRVTLAGNYVANYRSSNIQSNCIYKVANLSYDALQQYY